MGVIQDPQGAFVLVWEPKSHIGASLVNVAGALCWNELASPDLDASAGFYKELFEWSYDPIEDSPMPYNVIKNKDDHGNGGIRPRQEMEPSYWLVYFGSEDIDADLTKARDLGGNVLVEPMQIGPGRIAVLQDPQGAVFALYSGQFDD
jgi:predicted enzyme related to lactoylglutathione lyase